MATKTRKRKPPDGQEKLPRGVKLLRSLEGHTGPVTSLAFDPQGSMLASGCFDSSVKLWDVKSGRLLSTLEGHRGSVYSVVFDSHAKMLASGSSDGTVNLWDPHSTRLINTLKVPQGNILTGVTLDRDGSMLAVSSFGSGVTIWRTDNGELLHHLAKDAGYNYTVACHPLQKIVAFGTSEGAINLWEPEQDKLLRNLTGQSGQPLCVVFTPHGQTVAAGGFDKTISIWETNTGKLLRTLEGHTAQVDMIAFSSDGRLLASKSDDHTIRLWSCDTWETVAVIPNPTIEALLLRALAFHPTLPQLFAAGTDHTKDEDERSWLIDCLELDYDVLLNKRSRSAAIKEAVHHTTGKIVLVGDHSVGKSALGHRLIHSEFKEQASTHGQKLWVFPALGKRRTDGTECEAILWDFAGQPDYRLVHALFVDNADLALVLFDASDIHDPLHGVGFWLKQLKTSDSRCPILLVAAQTDRGTSPLTPDELKAFCQNHGIIGPISTSAFTGAGISELIERMKSLIPWEEKAATVTTTTFKRIKDYVLGLKESASLRRTIVTLKELRASLQATDADWEFTDDEMLTALLHLENYGYVRRLRTSKGDLRILLQPEKLNNLASSFVLEARRNPKDLGALEEKRLLAGGYDFPELAGLDDSECDALLDAAALLFLEHNVCFRETDPLRMEPYLVFPELINLKKPHEEDLANEEGAAYTISGPTENVFASLVVLLGYTHTFTRTAQWQNNARYEVGDHLVCGFRQTAERDGELDFVLCFGDNVGPSIRTLFHGLFESFLARRNLTVTRYEPVRCTNVACNHLLDRSVVRQRLKEGKSFTFCNDCGEKLFLPASGQPIHLSPDQEAAVQSQRRVAEQRTRFEQAVFSVRAYVAEQNIVPPECFISYAWGVPEHERWVEKRLATDLQKAGVAVLLDRWHNAQIGATIARFVERIEECEAVIVVGTPQYRQKAKNVVSDKGSVVAAEYDVAGIRLLATENDKRTVLPILLADDESKSFPALLRGRVYADFRKEEEYFKTAFDLILSLYQLEPTHPAIKDLRESLRFEELWAR